MKATVEEFPDERHTTLTIDQALAEASRKATYRMSWSMVLHALVTGFSAGFGYWLFNRLFR